MTIIERTNSPRRTEVCRLMIFVSDVIPMWIKVGVAGSVVWTFLLYLVSDDSLTIVLIGIAIIWLLSFLFLRKKLTD